MPPRPPGQLPPRDRLLLAALLLCCPDSAAISCFNSVCTASRCRRCRFAAPSSHSSRRFNRTAGEGEQD